MSLTPGENNIPKTTFTSVEDFETVFRQWYPSLCHTTYKIIKDKDKAEDIVQDVFVKMWENRKTVEINVSFKSYLFRSCINTALNEISKQKKYTHLQADEEIIISTQNSADTIEENELQKRIDQGLNLLPAACKSVFILSRFEEMTYKEIAETLDISIKTVENQMGKALKILREHLKDYLVILILLL